MAFIVFFFTLCSFIIFFSNFFFIPIFSCSTPLSLLFFFFFFTFLSWVLNLKWMKIVYSDSFIYIEVKFWFPTVAWLNSRWNHLNFYFLFAEKPLGSNICVQKRIQWAQCTKYGSPYANKSFIVNRTACQGIEIH